MSGLTYPMQLLNIEPQSYHLDYLDTLSTYDHHFLISKYLDACVEF